MNEIVNVGIYILFDKENYSVVFFMGGALFSSKIKFV